MPIINLKPGQPREERSDGVVLSTMDRAIVAPLITPLRVATGAGVLLIIAIAAYGFSRFGGPRTLMIGANRVTISEVSYGTFREYIPVTGNIVPRTSVYLDAIEGGQVTAVHVEAGETVTAGEPLVELKNTNLQLEVIGREAQLTEQLNNLSITSLALEQNRLRHQRDLIESDYQIDRLSRHLTEKQSLRASGATAQSEIDDLAADLKYQRALRVALLDAQRVDEAFQSTQVDTLREAILAMNRNLAIARENLDNLMIVASISGQLTSLDANVGESKSPGQRIGQIDGLNEFKVSAFIDEFYLSRVTIGQMASLEIDGRSYELEITKVYPDIRNRQLEIDLMFRASSPELIRRGQTVRMRLEIGQPADTLVLENGAFYEDTGGVWVFLVDSQGAFAERRNVRFGRRNPDGIEVIEGLRDGDRVITSGYKNFMDYDRVRLSADVT